MKVPSSGFSETKDKNSLYSFFKELNFLDKRFNSFSNFEVMRIL